MGMMSIGELADLLKSSAANEKVRVAFSGLTPLWRGVYGPYMVVTGSFQHGGDFEFAIRVEEEAISVTNPRKPTDLYIVD